MFHLGAVTQPSTVGILYFKSLRNIKKNPRTHGGEKSLENTIMKIVSQNVYTIFSSRLGDVTIQANDDGLLGIWFETYTTKPKELGREDRKHNVLAEACKQLTEYFEGSRKIFDVPLAAKGTDFQKQVWQALTQIPFGETWSYQDLANAIGNPKAVRAVGLANGKNPISVIVPCHRVIGKSGKLTGYAGGLERKKALLALEGIL